MEYLKNLYLLFFVFSTYIPVEKVPTFILQEVASKKMASFTLNKSQYAYQSLNSNTFDMPAADSFSKAFEGFIMLKEAGKIKNNILTIVDFSLSSTKKRLWVIDMSSNTILFHSLVAHGQNSGGDYAKSFSNENESFKSSLGFFTTAEVYNGAHGMSLKLDGLEKGINDRARQRSIVVHGADYVSNIFIRNHSRLGRSHGCPALPEELSGKIINTIKNKSCLFIYYPNQNYISSSKLIS